MVWERERRRGERRGEAGGETEGGFHAKAGRVIGNQLYCNLIT